MARRLITARSTQRALRWTLPAALALGAIAGTSGIGPAAAAPEATEDEPAWTATPGTGPVGTTVTVTSGTNGSCTWLQPVDEGDPILYIGSRVDLSLRRDGDSAPIGSVPVGPGGSWNGTTTIPAWAWPGVFELVPRCVVDDPGLDGVRSYEFGSALWEVTDPPPPTTDPPTTTTLAPTTTTVGTKVLGEVVEKPTATATATATATSGELAATGSGTVPIALAGLGALAIGATAVAAGRRKPATVPVRDDRHRS